MLLFRQSSYAQKIFVELGLSQTSIVAMLLNTVTYSHHSSHHNYLKSDESGRTQRKNKGGETPPTIQHSKIAAGCCQRSKMLSFFAVRSLCKGRLGNSTIRDTSEVSNRTLRCNDTRLQVWVFAQGNSRTLERTSIEYSLLVRKKRHTTTLGA